MISDCIDAVQEALGRRLRPGEAETIEKAVNRNMRALAQEDPEAWQKLSRDERLQQGAKAAADEMVAAVKERQRQLEMQIVAHDRVENLLNQAFERLPDNAKPGSMMKALSNLVAFDSTNRGRGLTSVESWAKGIQMEAMGHLVDAWKDVKGFGGLFTDHGAAEAIERELWGEDSGNPAAKAMADTWKQVTEELWERANKSGTNIGKLEDWHRPQSWSKEKIAGFDKDPSKALDHWIDQQMPRLDRSRYLNEDGTRMTDQDLAERVLTPAFDTLISDGFLKRTPGQNPKGNAGDISGHRVLFFKDADAYMAAQADFGNKNIWRSMQDHVARMSREIALRETFGPQHEDTFNYFNDRTAQDEIRQNPQAENKIQSARSGNQALYDYVSGHHQVVNQRVANWGQTFRNWMTATKLGSVVFTALGDEAGMASTAMANGIPYSQVLQHELKFMNPANSADRAAAAHAGLGLQTILGGTNRFGTEDFNLNDGVGVSAKAREFSGKVASAVLKYSGAEPMWDLRRRALGSVLMSALGKMVPEHENFSDLNEADHGMLARKGVTEDIWKTWRLAKPEDWESVNGVLTPKSIRDIPDEALRPLGDPQALRRNASTMLMSHVLEEVGMGVMEQGARQKAWTSGIGAQGGTAGAIAGELARSSLLFKGFSMSMMAKHWNRANSLEGAGTAKYYAALAGIGTIAGAAALQLQALSRGEDPPNVAEPMFWGNAILKGGGLGYLGEFLNNNTSSHGTDPVVGALGPVATTAEDLYNLTWGAAVKQAHGEKVDEGANLIRFVRGNNPLNTWYTKAAWDHLLWNHLQEAANPGYLDRMKDRASSSRGTSWWYDPTENLPHAAPDITKAFQPERGAAQIDAVKNVASQLPFVGSGE